MSEETILGKLDFVIETLKRIEARQIQVKGEIESQPVVGSFASTSEMSQSQLQHERTGH